MSASDIVSMAGRCCQDHSGTVHSGNESTRVQLSITHAVWFIALPKNKIPAFLATASFLIFRSTLIQTVNVFTLTCKSENMTHLSTFSHRFPFGLSGPVAKFLTIAAGSAAAKAALHLVADPFQLVRPFPGRIKHLAVCIHRILPTPLTQMRDNVHEREQLTCMFAATSLAAQWLMANGCGNNMLQCETFQQGNVA